ALFGTAFFMVAQLAIDWQSFMGMTSNPSSTITFHQEKTQSEEQRKLLHFLDSLERSNVTTTNDVLEILSSATHASSPSSSHSVESETTEPNSNQKYLIVHVGVPKTGTTAIQDDTKDNLTQALAQDGAIWTGKWMYPLSRTFAFFQRCLRDAEEGAFASGEHIRTRSVGDACWKKHMKMKGHPLMETPSENGPNVNIVTSYEEYAFNNRKNSTMVRFQRYFEDIHNYKIVGIVGYRRYHEYVRSNALQTYKRKCLSKKEPAGIEWPSNGGVSCQPVWDMARGLVMRDNHRGDVWLNIDELLPELRSLGMEMHVMNYNSPSYPGAITQNFYCGMLKNITPSTCQESLNMLERQKNAVRRNVGGVVDAYDAIILEAAQQGMINTTQITRKQARTQLMTHHTQALKKGFTDLPLICPPKSAMDRLFEKTLALEEKLSMDLFGTERVPPEIQAQHEQAFQKNVYTKRGYCSVNIDKLFANVTSYEELLQDRLALSDWGEPATYPKK
ncbi:MAG: hypothetical protein SGILL_010614, partial [Bacillariaceae sp.]